MAIGGRAAHVLPMISNGVYFGCLGSIEFPAFLNCRWSDTRVIFARLQLLKSDLKRRNRAFEKRWSPDHIINDYLGKINSRTPSVYKFQKKRRFPIGMGSIMFHVLLNCQGIGHWPIPERQSLSKINQRQQNKINRILLVIGNDQFIVVCINPVKLMRISYVSSTPD